jgi:quercetin dioxygenase-like cupin family protein
MPGPYALRIKIPSGIVPMPHVHPDTRMSVVLEGVYYFGYGEDIDEENMFELQPGSFFTEPSNIPHYGWAKPGTTVVIQSTGYGPTATAIVPRKDYSPPDKKR